MDILGSEPTLALYEISVGKLIKVKTEDGQFKRAEILEIADGGDLPIKVRFGGQKKGKEVWVRLEDCRLIRQISVNWEGFEAKLPVEQDDESRDKRQAVFSEWGQGKKFLTLEQLQDGVRKLLTNDFGADVEEVDTAVKGAWKAARNLAPPRQKNQKKAAKTVDAKEFHAFIVALRYYMELAELFEQLDSQMEDDQMLSFRECKRGIDKLQAWGINDEDLAVKFKGLDPWTPSVKFEDFSKWCVEERWSTMNLEMDLDSSDDEVQLQTGGHKLRAKVGIDNEDKKYGRECLQNRKKVFQVFSMADTNHSGKISEDELVKVFGELDSGITPEVARRMFRLADSNQDGEVDYEEFCLWLFR